MPGTRSVVFLGSSGSGNIGYGDGSTFNDPYRIYKGYHAPNGNYAYQAWAYDANDFVAVMNGQKKPWDLTPYATWRLQFSTGQRGDGSHPGVLPLIPRRDACISRNTKGTIPTTDPGLPDFAELARYVQQITHPPSGTSPNARPLPAMGTGVARATSGYQPFGQFDCRCDVRWCPECSQSLNCHFFEAGQEGPRSLVTPLCRGRTRFCNWEPTLDLGAVREGQWPQSLRVVQSAGLFGDRGRGITNALARLHACLIALSCLQASSLAENTRDGTPSERSDLFRAPVLTSWHLYRNSRNIIHVSFLPNTSDSC